ncbi:helix-turn-helix protein [Hephaestia caeni]|uniref:Helix-turn-helix protein n=1 Tax=Hephaestia caeni TaxID=645617 RepID=A0A397ND59_9SPHN|nr:helix-turn-helix transcriptional regulator [Hephaestia caeni]RIA35376.1 helix-turn-helix protein [Hephaestia caeni]
MNIIASSSPDGVELVTIPRAEYDRLMALVGDDLDGLRAAEEALADDARYPAAVVDMILDDGLSPLAAWRRYRGLSQAELAEKAGMSQTGVAALERRPNAQGRRSTRKALAEALGITVSALNPLTD